MRRIPHLDAANSAFVSRQLEALKSKEFEVKRQNLKWRDLFPPGESIPAGATTIVYRIWEQLGMVKLISNYADDLPRSDAFVKERTSPIKSLGGSFGWNIKEIDQARLAGVDLDTKKRNGTLRAFEERFQDIALFGDADTDLPGFLSNPNIPVLSAHDAGASTFHWEDKTADEILKDMNDLANYPFQNTRGTESADTMLLPINEFNIAAQKRIGVDSDMTVLKYFLATNQFITDVDWLPELDTASALESGPMAVVYRRDPEVLTREVAREPESLAPQPNGLETVVPMIAETGGVLVYYPLACAFMDNIGPLPA